MGAFGPIIACSHVFSLGKEEAGPQGNLNLIIGTILKLKLADHIL